MDSTTAPMSGRARGPYFMLGPGWSCHWCGKTQIDWTMDVSAWPAISVVCRCSACGRGRDIRGRFREVDPLAPFIWWFDQDAARSARPLMVPPIPEDIRAVFDEGNPAPVWVHPSIVGIARGQSDHQEGGFCGITPAVADYCRHWARPDLIRALDWDWEHYPRARRFDQCAGLAFLPNDLDAMRRLPGTITDADLFPVD